MLFDDTLPLPSHTSHLCQTEHEDLVDIHQLIIPEFVFVKNVRSEQFCRDTTGQVFETLSMTLIISDNQKVT